MHYHNTKLPTPQWSLLAALSDGWDVLTFGPQRRKWWHRLCAHRRDGRMLHQHTWGWHGRRSLEG